MEELTIEQDIEIEEKQKEKVNKQINKLTKFLVNIEKDYELKTFDSGEGREVIIEAKDEDEQEDYNQTKKYNVKFTFYDTGYVSIDVETKEEPEPIEVLR